MSPHRRGSHHLTRRPTPAGFNDGNNKSIRADERQQPGTARELLRFDFEGKIPAGYPINSAPQTLTVTLTSDLGVDSTFDAHRAGHVRRRNEGRHPIVEGEASWNDRLGTVTP